MYSSAPLTLPAEGRTGVRVVSGPILHSPTIVVGSQDRVS